MKKFIACLLSIIVISLIACQIKDPSDNNDFNNQNNEINLIFDLINNALVQSKKTKNLSVNQNSVYIYDVGQIILFDFEEYTVEGSLKLSWLLDIIGDSPYRVVGASIYFSFEEITNTDDFEFNENTMWEEKIIYIEGSKGKTHALLNGGTRVEQFDNEIKSIHSSLRYSSHKTIENGFVVKNFDKEIYKVEINFLNNTITDFYINNSSFKVSNYYKIEDKVYSYYKGILQELKRSVIKDEDFTLNIVED
jgi:hypothetical protein